MPLATSSQAVMPPNTLTKTLLTAGSDSTISRPLAITAARRAAADVEEVGRADPAELLARVRDHVQRRHDQAGAVADDADRAVELDVVEVALLGPLLQRVDRRGVLERLVVRVPEAALPSKVIFASSSRTRPSATLASGFTSTSSASSATNVCQSCTAMSAIWSATSAGKPAVVDDLARGRLVDALVRVDRDLGDLLRRLVRDLFDLHAAGDAGDAQERAVRAVQQVGEVVLLDDVGGLGDHHLVDRVALDVHAEDVGRPGLRLVGVRGQLDAAGLAAAADLHLRLDDRRGRRGARRSREPPPGSWRRRRPAPAGRAGRTGRAPGTRTGPR